jgi:hypothetical protein
MLADEVGWLPATQRPETIRCPLHLSLSLTSTTKQSSDLDNRLKACLDLLVARRMIERGTPRRSQSKSTSGQPGRLIFLTIIAEMQVCDLPLSCLNRGTSSAGSVDPLSEDVTERSHPRLNEAANIRLVRLSRDFARNRAHIPSMMNLIRVFPSLAIADQ